MACIRLVEISSFRGINELKWYPQPGVNCLIGPGDSGKSSILDAIDLCLGARRNVQFTDADFHCLDVDNPIEISLTIGELPDALKKFDTYGLYLRGFNVDSGEVEDEPRAGAETVLTLRLSVASDLEPNWFLVSQRAEAQGQSRNLNWADRLILAPTKIGTLADHHLSWRRGSVLNRVSEEKADASAALAKAGRDARAAFGDEAQEQLGDALQIVAHTATELGIPVGEKVRAMLDAHSVSFSGGTIALHDENGIPLRGLGIGSTRLLIAGLQRAASLQSPVILVDELEYGLEPHRIVRLLGSLGAKEESSPFQVFVTTHSPVALRELSGEQLFVIRAAGKEHHALLVGDGDEEQSTIRLYPEAFLAPTVLVCEGASEIGFVRGLDRYRTAQGKVSINARGVALVDCGGGDADKPYKRAMVFQRLGYRTAVFRDDDKKPTKELEASYKADSGTVLVWQNGRAIEDELFLSVSDVAVGKLIDLAIELQGNELVDDHIKSVSNNSKNLNDIQLERIIEGVGNESRSLLGEAARRRRAGWFKSITWMERVAHEIVGPDYANSEGEFVSRVNQIFSWAHGGE
jgi:hypothetical protein